MSKRERKQISVEISIEHLDKMDRMVDEDMFSSRASIIRRALKEFFEKPETRILA